jgi:hypothetical protein
MMIVLLAFLLFVLPIEGIPAAAEEQQLLPCDLHQGGCRQPFSGGEATLDITPKPVRTMQDLTFRVTLSGKTPSEELSLDLTMPGMEMGQNRVLLKPVREGVYEGRGVIVRCPSGSKTWKAMLTVPAVGSVSFIFNVLD